MGVTRDRESWSSGDVGKLLLTSRTRHCCKSQPAWDRARDVLAMGFLDGNVVQGTPARDLRGHQDVPRIPVGNGRAQAVRPS